MISTALPDWRERLLAGRSLVPELPLNLDEADHALRIFKRLRLPDVIGNPRIGEVCAPWFYRIAEVLFGSYDVERHERSVQEYFVLVPKKNGKSTLSAALMLVAIIRNRRPDAEFTFLAPTIEVAGISFRQARSMVKLDPQINKQFHVQDNIRRITHIDSGAFLQIKAAAIDIVTGMKPLGVLIDETHVFGELNKAADIFSEVRGALAARKDGFLWQISTQSKAPPSGVFRSELQRARDVRDGRLSLPKPLLAVLYELPEDVVDDWRNEKYWPLVNPSLGHSVDIDFLRSALIDAERKGRGELALLASQHFNVEIGMALHSDRWSGADFWQQQTDASITLESIIERSETCVCGIDGGGLDDLLGFCVLGRMAADREVWLCYSFAWCHQIVLQRRQSIAQRLNDFAARNELTIVDDQLDAIQEMIDIIAMVKDAGKLAAVAVDPWSIGAIVDALGNIGVTPENKQVVGITQGQSMMPAIKAAEIKLANGTLKHSNSALMAWCVGNCKVEATANAIRITKANAGDAKIDAAMAMLDAVTVMAKAPAKAPEFQMMVLA